MTIDKILKNGTTFFNARLKDGYPIRVEVQKCKPRETAGGYGAPPFVAIAADGNLAATCAPGETAELAALELLERLNHRYC